MVDVDVAVELNVVVDVDMAVKLDVDVYVAGRVGTIGGGAGTTASGGTVAGVASVVEIASEIVGATLGVALGVGTASCEGLPSSEPSSQLGKPLCSPSVEMQRPSKHLNSMISAWPGFKGVVAPSQSYAPSLKF